MLFLGLGTCKYVPESLFSFYDYDLSIPDLTMKTQTSVTICEQKCDWTLVSFLEVLSAN